MVETKGEEVYIFHKYIMKIIDKYDNELMHPEKFNQHLYTLGRWEGVFRKLSKAKREMLWELLKVNNNLKLQFYRSVNRWIN